MEKFKYLEHTADAKFQAFGKTIEEAFANAALAMFNVMMDVEKIEPKIKRQITASGDDSKSLLYNWLEQLLVLLDSESFLLSKVDEIKIGINEQGGYSLKAAVSGDDDIEKYESHGEVKAVTYNEMEIKEEKDNYMVQVVVDV